MSDLLQAQSVAPIYELPLHHINLLKKEINLNCMSVNWKVRMQSKYMFVR
jgi:hypothetical protein